MADNLTTQSTTPATVPAASVIATDDVSGVHFQKVKLDGGTDGLTAPISGDTANGLDVDVTRVSGTVAVSGPLTDTQLRLTAVPVSGTVTATPTGTQNVDATANTIGLATGAKQDTGNTSIASVDTKTPALGQALAAAATPVVLTVIQQAALTPPAAISGFALDATLTNATQKTKLVDSAGTNVAAVDANGALAIQSGGVTAAAVPARAIQVAGSDGTNLRALKVSAAGVVSTDGSAATQPVSQTAATIPTATVMQNAAVAVANGTNLNTRGYVSTILSITGTFVGTITFEASVDDTTFVAITAHQVGVAGSLVASSTTTGDFRINSAGYKSVRARISAYTSGSVTVNGYASPLAGHATTVNANVITLPVAFGAAASSATTQRTVAASDSPEVVTLGAKTDAKSSASDATSISMMQVLKQISFELQRQNPAIINTFVSSEGSTTGTTVSTIDLNTSGMTNCYEIEIINKLGGDVLNYTVGTSAAAPADPTTSNSGFLPAGGVPSAITLPNSNAVNAIRVKVKSGATLTYAINAKGFI